MLTNEQLLRRLTKLCRAARQIDVGVVLLLIQIEDRRLHLEAACPSLHDFCRRHLRWSDGTTHRRVEAARVARRCPSIVGHLRSGAITLSALALARAHIEESNVEQWVPRLAGKSRRQIEAMLADLAPKPDVPSLIRQLPPRPGAEAAARADQGGDATLPRSTDGQPSAAAEGFVIAPPPPTRPARLQPLGDARWKIQLMARQALHDKVERVQALMRHRNPSGDLAVVFEAAIDALIERLEKPRRLRVPANARASRPTRREGAVSASTRREVFARDEERCTFVSADGERCPATERLEIDHILSKALGGSGEASNLRLRCQPHNRLHAEKVFGREHVERRIRERKAARPTPSKQTSPRDSAHEGAERPMARVDRGVAGPGRARASERLRRRELEGNRERGEAREGAGERLVGKRAGTS